MEKGRLPNLERRKFPRLKDNIFIFCKLRSNLAKGFKALTKDISAGGLMFETERNIPKRSELELEIYQPLNRDKTMIFCIPILAKLVWTGKIEKGHFESGENKYRIGIEFLEIEVKDRQKIVKYVNKR